MTSGIVVGNLERKLTRAVEPTIADVAQLPHTVCWASTISIVLGPGNLSEAIWAQAHLLMKLLTADRLKELVSPNYYWWVSAVTLHLRPESSTMAVCLEKAFQNQGMGPNTDLNQDYSLTKPKPMSLFFFDGAKHEQDSQKHLRTPTQAFRRRVKSFHMYKP